MLSWKATPDQWQVDELGALAAGAYGSIQALSRRAGETGFEGCFQHGNRRSLHLYSVPPTFLLLSIFDSGIAPGVVRLYAGEASQRLQQYLRKLTEPSGAPEGCLRSGDLSWDEVEKPVSR